MEWFGQTTPDCLGILRIRGRHLVLDLSKLIPTFKSFFTSTVTDLRPWPGLIGFDYKRAHCMANGPAIQKFSGCRTNLLQWPVAKTVKGGLDDSC